MGMKLAEQVDADLKKEISPEDALLRLAGVLDDWCELITQRVERLEAVTKIDRQNMEEVDKSVRQTWEVLDGRVKKLEGAQLASRPPHQIGQ
jgi:hypothetical protein